MYSSKSKKYSAKQPLLEAQFIQKNTLYWSWVKLKLEVQCFHRFLSVIKTCKSELQCDGGLQHQRWPPPLALRTWSSSKSFDRHAGQVLGPSPHSHPAAVPWRSGLPRLHHWPYGNQGQSVVGWLLGSEWLAWRTDLDRVHAGLLWLAGIVRLPGARWRRWDDERDVDLLDSRSALSRIWQRSWPLWS